MLIPGAEDSARCTSEQALTLNAIPVFPLTDTQCCSKFSPSCLLVLATNVSPKVNKINTSS